MNDDLFTDPCYWSVDLPGLSMVRALQVVEWAGRENAAVGASAVDPSHWFTSHLDEESVTVLVAALGSALASGSLSSDAVPAVQGLLEELLEWLAWRQKSG
jgi:hypothetical protein